MALSVRKKKTTRYELSGSLEASKLFPKLLAGSDDELEIEGHIESEYDDGWDYDYLDSMDDEVCEFTGRAVAHFHDAALAAAKALLTTPGLTLLHRDFKEDEEDVLEEAATKLGINVPWGDMSWRRKQRRIAEAGAACAA